MLKVLVIHNLHRTGSASGDDQVFYNETALMKKNGIDVVTYTVSNDDFDNVGPWGKICATAGMIWSFKNYRAVRNIIRQEKPDIVHIHTFFPLLSPSILYAAKRENVKVVATLHDTRFICPCATSLRGTEICNKCGDGKYFRMCGYKCFKGSALMSFVVACVFKYHRLRRSFYDQIDKYICLNDTQIELLENIGFKRDKIVKKYNFVPGDMGQDKENAAKNALRDIQLPERYAIYYGRLGEEKGIPSLMKAWDELPEIPLVIVGGGPLEKEVEKWADGHDNVHYLGYLNHDRCLSIVGGAEFVVFPSIWYEGCSMVELESEMMGKAIVAYDIGFSRELITDGKNGCLVPLKRADLLTQKVKELWSDKDRCRQMGEAAKADYDSRFGIEDNYRQLVNIYNEVL